MYIYRLPGVVKCAFAQHALYFVIDVNTEVSCCAVLSESRRQHTAKCHWVKVCVLFRCTYKYQQALCGTTSAGNPHDKLSAALTVWKTVIVIFLFSPFLGFDRLTDSHCRRAKLTGGLKTSRLSSRYEQQQHVGRQRVQDPLSRRGSRGSSGPVCRRQGGQSVGDVHRGHAESDPGVPELGVVAAQRARCPQGAGCSLWNRVMASHLAP